MINRAKGFHLRYTAPHDTRTDSPRSCSPAPAGGCKQAGAARTARRAGLRSLQAHARQDGLVAADRPVCARGVGGARPRRAAAQGRGRGQRQPARSGDLGRLARLDDPPADLAKAFKGRYRRSPRHSRLKKPARRGGSTTTSTRTWPGPIAKPPRAARTPARRSRGTARRPREPLIAGSPRRGSSNICRRASPGRVTAQLPPDEPGRVTA